MKTVGASSTPSVATPRAVLIGLALAVVVNLFSLWSNYLLGYVHITFAHIDLGLLIPFFLGVLGPNILIKAVRPSWGLQNKELLFVFVLGWVGFMVPAWGMSNYVVNVMATAEYYASPENQWRELVFPFLPDWVIVTNEQNANRDYYWGLPASAPIPWSAWIIPSFWWMSFFAGLLAVGICFVILMRRQWAEHERLSYPLAQTPVVMTETTGETDEVLPSIMRNRMFIAGAVVTFSIMLWNTASYWTQWTSFPVDANTVISLELGRSFPAHPIRMNVLTFAFSYFINVDILFSVWVFQIINTLEQGVLARIGIAADSGTAVPGGLVAVQFIGGMIAFALWGFWIARRHLKTVWRHVLGHDTNLRDEDELISYRAALAIGVFGLGYIVWWLNAAGMSFPVIAVFLTLLVPILLRAVPRAGGIGPGVPGSAHQRPPVHGGHVGFRLPVTAKPDRSGSWKRIRTELEDLYDDHSFPRRPASVGIGSLGPRAVLLVCRHLRPERDHRHRFLGIFRLPSWRRGELLQQYRRRPRLLQSDHHLDE